MATFTYTPDFGAAKAMTPQVVTVKFGEGYEQRYSKGMNSTPQKWDLRFAQREAAEANAITAFLDARGGVESFDWTPPDSNTVIRVKCAEGYSKIIEKYNRYSISCVFEQVFEPSL